MKKPLLSSPVEVRVEAQVNPSEDHQKVIEAIGNIVSGCYLEFKYGSRVIGKAAGVAPLETIYTQLRSRSALGVVRRMMIYNKKGSTTWFLLNKQAAAAGLAVVIEDEQESPLGPIRLYIECEEIDTIIEWLAPQIER